MTTTSSTPTPARRSVRRLLAAALVPLVGAVALGLGGAPAGAAPAETPSWRSAVGYDVPGPTSHHRLLWTPGDDGGEEVTGYTVERWNAAQTQLLATYEVPADHPDLTVEGVPDNVISAYRISAENSDGSSGFAGFVTVKSTPGKSHFRPFSSEDAFLTRQLDDFGVDEPLGFWPAFVKDADTSVAFLDDLYGRPSRANRAKVVRLYFAYFDRAPEPGGLQYWQDRLDSGQATLSKVSSAFAASAEFKALYGGTTNTEFVSLVYGNVLFRAPDATGLAFWVDQLDSGKTTRGKLMIGFSESAEGKALRRADTIIADVYATVVREPVDDYDLSGYRPYVEGGGTAGSLAYSLLTTSGYPLDAD